MGAKSRPHFTTGGWCKHRKDCKNRRRCNDCVQSELYVPLKRAEMPLETSHSGEYIEIELKTKTGKLRHNQQVIIGHGGSTRCCRSIEAFMLAVREWEAGYATGGSRTA